MSKIRGMGGFWVVGGAPLEPGDPNYVGGGAPPPPGVIQHNAEYTLSLFEETKQSRTTNGRGWTEGLPVIRRVDRAFFRVAEDDPSGPEVLGFVIGKELTVYLKTGELQKYDRIVRAIVESVHKDNNQTKARWIEVSLKHGRYEHDVAPPALPGA